MEKFEEKKFEVGALKGISAKTIEEHLKLYAGYVKNANAVIEKISSLSQEFFSKGADNSYLIGELFRRFSFEYNGMRNHEFYFRSFENGPAALADKSPLRATISETFGSFDAFLNRFKAIALTRGVGWAMLYFDPLTKRLLTQWVDEQHLGQLNGCQTILALDMWEHSYVADYQPSGKKNYVEDFFANLNWGAVEKNFTTATGKFS